MSGDMSREDLLAMLSGGAKKKKRNPWLSFLKKHPNLSMAEASKKYHSKKGKGVEFEGGMTEGEDEFYIEGGKIKRRRRKKKATRKRRGRGVGEESFGMGYSGGADEGYEDDFDRTTYQTRIFKDLDKQKKLAWGVYQLWKKIYKKEFDIIQRKTGAGATEMDFKQFAKEAKTSGVELRDAWDAKLATQAYESPREVSLLALGKKIRDDINDPGFVFLMEQGIPLS
jgi:hypothetical protein